MKSLENLLSGLEIGNTSYRIPLKTFWLFGVVFAITGFYKIQAQDEMIHSDTTNVLIYEAGSIEWQAGPASLEKEAQLAILEGNPGEEGYFNIRLKLPDGFLIAPHWHPKIERITVISGNFLLGHGKDANAATQRLGPGSYVSLPKEMVHFARADGETIVQLATLGPWDIIYVNTDDDPRKR